MVLHRVDYNGGDIWVDLTATRVIGSYYTGQGFAGMSVFKWSESQFKSFPDHKGVVVAQSTNLSLPNIPYVEIEEDIVCPFCQGKMKATKEYLGDMFYLSCESEDYKCPAKNMTCDGEMGFIDVSMLTAKEVEDDAKRRLAASAKKYTEEDLIAFGKKCFYKGFNKSETDDANCFTAWREESFNLIQSLQPKPVNIEIETTCSVCGLVDAHKMSCKTESARTQVPVTNIKGGKTFVKVKKVNYES